MDLGSLFCLVSVALLWGLTNPFLKAGSAGVDDIKRSDPLRQALAQTAFLATKFRVGRFLRGRGSWDVLSDVDLSFVEYVSGHVTLPF